MSVSKFVDPRESLYDLAETPPARTTAEKKDLVELHRLCREGRLYDVERWILQGRPLQTAPGLAQKGQTTSALELALEARNQALALLLLRNGYDPNLEKRSPLNLAFKVRRWDLVDLLLEAGADPDRTSVSTLLDTYNSGLIERFRNLGVDVTANHELAAILGYHASAKPLYGFAKRHIGDLKIRAELNMALAHHASEGNEEGVELCLWAGADPHAPAPSLSSPELNTSDSNEPDDQELGWSAIEEACLAGNAKILQRLGPDPSLDNYDYLFGTAGSGAVIELLANSALPKNVGAIIHRHLSWSRVTDRGKTIETLTALFQIGARWETSPADEIAQVRRILCDLPRDTFVDAMKLLAAVDHCDESVLRELGRTPAARAKMKKAGFTESLYERSSYARRPTRSREVLIKFGVIPAKATHPLPPIVNIGNWYSEGGEVHLTREQLFEQVWTTPVYELAREWDISDRGLGKACRRLKIPVPPRGHWAKILHGQNLKRPRLPQLKPGEAGEIVIRRAPRSS